MTTANPDHECALLDGGELGRITFQWIGDRYQHFWVFGGEEARLLESIESDHSVPWPDSPPLQQVYRQTFEDGRDVMFGIGMSGRGHWSVSFTLVPDLRSWIVELACCSPVVPEVLSSRYRIQADDWRIQDGNEDSIQHCSHPNLGIKLEPISGLTRMDVQGDKLRFSPLEIPKTSSNGTAGSATIQWGYRLRIR